ncbi:AcrR family transcriptional regulator [Lipingzhangella halophila]|uniref:AcrR family transcriptional regulator n=1 Tax=Lipingzhangella halophila TaxID=1783352 RepID=A0A7W7RJ72_9ACTN|nr:TetR/AcrR family transcriptional regulator [Lipingzhangella halophila]MBB4932573.1 AcrR family transcriptional regulator [Lipingzhangella halophila]
MDHEPRRRRRGAALEEAIFAAVRTQLDESGYANLSMTSVAECAGTSKPVLYRRWPSRARLVYAAVAHGHRTVAGPADTGALRGDLVALMETLVRRARWWRPDTIWGLLADSADDPELLREIRESLLEPRERSWMEEILTRAAGRGEIAPGGRSTRQLDLPSELLRSEYLLHGGIGGSTVAEIVDEILLPLLTAPTCSGRNPLRQPPRDGEHV